MKTGPRKYGAATLQVLESRAVPEHMQPHVREVVRIFCEPKAREMGNTDELLRRTTQEADRDATILMLSAKPEESETEMDRLTALYRRHGFEYLQDNLMIRAPRH